METKFFLVSFNMINEKKFEKTIEMTGKNITEDSVVFTIHEWYENESLVKSDAGRVYAIKYVTDFKIVELEDK